MNVLYVDVLVKYEERKKGLTHVGYELLNLRYNRNETSMLKEADDQLRKIGYEPYNTQIQQILKDTYKFRY